MKIKKVISIHDVIHKIYPKHYSFIDRQFYHQKILHGTKMADKIIAISENTKQDLILHYRLDENKIEVLPPNIHPVFFEKSSSQIENFPALPKKYFVRCAELYSFCRLLDDIADTNTKDENFIKLNFILDLIEKHDFQKLEENNIYVPSYLKNRELAKSKIIDLIHGLIFDQKLVRIKSEEQLILYCYRVAGTVGVLMCIALECKDKNSFNFAIDLGIAMQLTNILRDIEEDSKFNRLAIFEVSI